MGATTKPTQLVPSFTLDQQQVQLYQALIAQRAQGNFNHAQLQQVNAMLAQISANYTAYTNAATKDAGANPPTPATIVGDKSSGGVQQGGRAAVLHSQPSWQPMSQLAPMGRQETVAKIDADGDQIKGAPTSPRRSTDPHTALQMPTMPALQITRVESGCSIGATNPSPAQNSSANVHGFAELLD